MSALTHIDADPRLIFELAAQVDRPQEIALRYELDPDYLAEMMEVPRVKKMIREKKAELDKMGYSLTVKAKMCFEDLLGDVYKKAKKPDATLAAVLDAAKFMRTVAGLDKTDVTVGNEKFSIQINIGGQTATIKAQTGDIVDVAPITRVDVDLPQAPEWLENAFDFNASLAYAE